MKISLSGSTYGGKSTLLENFNRKYTTHNESGFILIKKWLKIKNIDDLIKWRKNNTEGYYAEIISYQLNSENNCNPNIVNMFDRCIIDYIALLSIETGKDLLSFQGYLNLINIDYVFVFYPLSNFSERKTTGRLLNKKQSIILGKKIEELCNLLRINYSIVPNSTTEIQKTIVSNVIEKLKTNI